MRPGNLSLTVVALHLGEDIKQLGFQLLSVIDGEITVVVMDNPIWGTLAICFFHQQTIRCQLINMRVIRRFGGASRFHFHGNDLSILLDEVIRLARQTERLMEERLLQFAPATRIGINDASAGKPRSFALAIRLPEEEHGQEEDNKGKVKHLDLKV